MIREAILKSIRAGNYAKVSARAAGLDESTYYDWLRADPDFRLAVEKAEADRELALVKTVKGAAGKSWQAGMTMLERLTPERWGRRDVQKVELTTKYEAMTEEELAAKREELIKSLPDPNPGTKLPV